MHGLTSSFNTLFFNFSHDSPGRGERPLVYCLLKRDRSCCLGVGETGEERRLVLHDETRGIDITLPPDVDAESSSRKMSGRRIVFNFLIWTLEASFSEHCDSKWDSLGSFSTGRSPGSATSAIFDSSLSVGAISGALELGKINFFQEVAGNGRSIDVIDVVDESGGMGDEEADAYLGFFKTGDSLRVFGPNPCLSETGLEETFISICWGDNG